MSSRTINVVLVVGTLFAMALIGEAVLRIKSAITDTSPAKDQQLSSIKHYGYNPFLIFGPDINKRLPQANGEYAAWNSQGFRMDRDLPLVESPGEYRVFALGGSTTEDIPNGQNLHYCGVANEYFTTNISRRVVTCINTGKSAFSTAHMLVRLQSDLLPFKPDMITIMENINDLTVNFFPHDGRFNYGNKYFSEAYAPSVSSGSVLGHWARASRLVSYVINTMHKVKTHVSARPVYTTSSGEVIRGNLVLATTPNPLPFADVFRNNLVSLVATAKAHGIRPVLMTQPADLSDEQFYRSFAQSAGPMTVPPPDEFRQAFEAYNRIIKDVAQSTHSDFIDLYTLVGHDSAHFVDIVHTSPQGVRRVGEIYARELTRIIRSSP